MGWDLYIDESGTFDTVDGKGRREHNLIGGFVLPQGKFSREASNWFNQIRHAVYEKVGTEQLAHINRHNPWKRMKNDPLESAHKEFDFTHACNNRMVPGELEDSRAINETIRLAQLMILDEYCQRIKALGGKIVVFDDPTGEDFGGNTSNYLTILGKGKVSVMDIIMGKNYRDIVTGFEDICTGIVEWMYGCQQYTLQPRSDDAAKKEKPSLFFAKQLELVDEGISDKVETPAYNPPAFFGKECVDKVTGVHGMCIGRGYGLFSSPQYVLEIQPEDHEKPSRYEWLDEGRVEAAENPSREIDPETVKGEKPGSGFFPDFLPEFGLF